MRFRDKGRTVVIIASGGSAGITDLEPAHGWPTVVVNDAWALAPHADILYGCDYRWWKLHAERTRQGFSGERWCQDARACQEFGLRYIALESRAGLSRKPGLIYSGGRTGNSGAQAINLAYLLGARRLLLVGFDFYGTHFFGEHPKPLSANSNFEAMRASMCQMAEELHLAGVTVVNCSAHSRLTFWPKYPLFDCLPSHIAPLSSH